jgi:tight adherence protein C
MTTTDLYLCAAAGLAMSAALLVYLLAASTAVAPPALGLRGYERHRARLRSPAFASAEPAIGFMAGWFAGLPLGRRRMAVERKLAQAGHWFGLSADELYALALIGGLAGLGFGALGMVLVDGPLFASFFFAVLAWWFPFSHIDAVITRRKREVSRGLPGTVEMIALCMSAGLDFPGALRRITGSQQAGDSLHDELCHILRELDLGHTRAAALRGFASRIPLDEVADFVAAVLQAEARGNPLREVLRIQASVLRTRRSIRAEEMAARTSVLMIGPMALLMGSTLLLIGGPLMIKIALQGWGGD